MARGRRPVRRFSSEERRALILNPPKGAWIERREDGRIYLRWREGRRKLSLRISEEEAEEVRRRIVGMPTKGKKGDGVDSGDVGKPTNKGDRDTANVGTPTNGNAGMENVGLPTILEWEALRSLIEEAAERGDEDALWLVRRGRLLKDGSTLKRVLRVVRRWLSGSYQSPRG